MTDPSSGARAGETTAEGFTVEFWVMSSGRVLERVESRKAARACINAARISVDDTFEITALAAIALV